MKITPTYMDRTRVRLTLTLPDGTSLPPGDEFDLADQTQRELHARGIANAAGRTDWPDIASLLEQMLESRQRELAPSPPPDHQFQPFPVEALPPIMRNLCEQGAQHLQQDASILALPLLSAAAAAIGTAYRVCPDPTWSEPAIIWTALVMPPGSMKTPAIRLATAGIRDRDTQSYREHEAAMAAWNAENEGKPGTKQSDAPVHVVYRTSACTLEGLRSALAHNQHGLLMDPDELTAWVKNFDRYTAKAGGEESAWLSLWSGEPVSVILKSQPLLRVPNPAVSITGGIQPGVLASTFSREKQENGMLGRLLFAMPPANRYRLIRGDDAAVAAAEMATKRMFSNLYSLEPAKVDGTDITPHQLTLNDSAFDLLAQFVDEQEARRLYATDDHAANIWAKLRGYSVRLALVHHLCRWASGEQVGHQIDATSMSAGITLAYWFGREAERVYDRLRENQAQRETRQLIELIQRQGGNITARQLAAGSKRFRGGEAETLLQRLVDQGVGRWELVPPGPQGGRPTRRLVLLNHLFAHDGQGPPHLKLAS